MAILAHATTEPGLNLPLHTGASSPRGHEVRGESPTLPLAKLASLSSQMDHAAPKAGESSPPPHLTRPRIRKSGRIKLYPGRIFIG